MNPNVPLSLHFRKEPQDPLPRLILRQGHLAPAEMQALEQAVEGAYTELHRKKDGAAVKLHGRLFVLTVHNRTSRMPELVLEQATTAANSVPVPLQAPPTLSWPEGLLGTLEEMFGDEADPLGADAPDRAGVNFVLTELRALAGKGAEHLAAVLLAGYLSLAGQLTQAGDSSRGLIYALAQEGLERLLQARTDAVLPGKGQLPERLHPTPRPRQWTLVRQLCRWFGGGSE